MQDLEPFYNWHFQYLSQEDTLSPFYGRTYSETTYDKTVYNYYIHPQWDEFGSSTLYIKVLFADYDQKFVIIEMIGEWNDAINNDIMFLKRDVIDIFIENGISQFILIGENVLNFFYEDDSYYQEWIEDIENEAGWIAMLNFQEHVFLEMLQSPLKHYLILNEELQSVNWRLLKPEKLYELIDDFVIRKLE
jgi:hypothetical protein